MCWLAHTNTLRCCAPSSLVFSFCVSLPPPSPSTSALLSLSERNEWGEWQTPSTHLCLPNNVWKKGGAAQTRPGLRPQRHSPHLSLCTLCGCHAVCCFTHSTTQKVFVLQKERRKKRDDDTWCSQVVSNPSTNQARRGLTSLIRREVVLSSWYGRNSFLPQNCGLL